MSESTAAVVVLLAVFAFVVVFLAFCALAFGLIFRVLWKRSQASRQVFEQFAEHGHRAEGRILTVDQGAIIRRSDLQVVLSLEVTCADDPSGPYGVRLSQRVPQIVIPRVQAGQVIPLRVDPDDRHRVMVDLVAMGCTQDRYILLDGHSSSVLDRG